MTTNTKTKVVTRLKKEDENQPAQKVVTVGTIDLPMYEGHQEFVPKEQDYLDTTGHLEAIAYAVKENLPTLLIGETGTGKTSAIRHLAHITGNNFRRINLNGSTTVDELVGKILIDKDGTYWTDGVLTDAMRKGHWLLLDEINAALPEVLFTLHSLLDDDGYVVLSDKEDKEIVRPHANFRIFATCNPFEDYVGTKELNKAFMSRFPMVIELKFPTKEMERDIVKMHGGNIPDVVLDSMLKVVEQCRVERANRKLDFVFSTRDLLHWVKLYGFTNSAHRAAEYAFLAKANTMDRDTIAALVDVHVREENGVQDIRPGMTFYTRKHIFLGDTVVLAGTRISVKEMIPKTDVRAVEGDDTVSAQAMSINMSRTTSDLRQLLADAGMNAMQLLEDDYIAVRDNEGSNMLENLSQSTERIEHYVSQEMDSDDWEDINDLNTAGDLDSEDLKNSMDRVKEGTASSFHIAGSNKKRTDLMVPVARLIGNINNN